MVVLDKVSVAIAGLASIASAVPTTRKFSVNQVARPATKTANFAANYGRALSKYGAAVPSHVQAAAAASGVATTTPEANDEAYLTPVTIGGTTLNLDIDTGSADL
jgi:aspergillopepsin I